MELREMLEGIDAEIARLEHARSILVGGSNGVPKKRGPGRPRKYPFAAPRNGSTKRGSLSPEARKRISEAMKARWASKKKK